MKVRKIKTSELKRIKNDADGAGGLWKWEVRDPFHQLISGDADDPLVMGWEHMLDSSGWR
jgi:hypothetical protein